MSGGPGTASPEIPSQDGRSGEWRRIYDRVEVLAATAGERARLAEAREKSLHARLLQAEASRRRWKTAYIEMPLLANPKIIELKENDLKDYQSCEDDDHLQFKILPTEATSSVEVRQYNEDHEAIAGELRAELRKLKQAYETLSSEKDKEISGLLGVKDFLWNQLRTIDKENMGLLKIKEVEAAQATEAAQKIHQNIEDMQVAAQKVQQNIEGMKVAARKKDDKVGRLQAEASNVKKKVLIDDGKLLEMHSLIKDKNDEIQRLKSKARRKHSKIACEKHLEQCTCYIMAPKESPKEALFQMRFAAKRLRGVVEKNMSAAKREIIARTPFRELLYVSPFAAPMELIEFVVMNTNPKLREFRFRDKAIVFTRDMVRRVLGVPSGNRPMDFLKRSQQSEIRDKYKNEKGRTTVAKAIELLETCADTDELMVVQSFGLIAFATVLCPGTGNTVCCEYLGSLMDINAIEQYAMDEHILSEVMSEVELFKEKVQRRPELDGTQIQWIGQCLPMLATIYMDFLSFPALAPGEHTINYNIPRFCYVCDADFELVVEIDKNKLSLLPASFGNRPLLPLSRTVYAPAATANTPPSNGAKVDANASPPLGAMAKECDAKKNSEDVEVNLSASLNEWPDKHLPSSQDLQVPERLQGLYNKHKDLYASEVDAALNHFGQFVKVLQAKRMTTLLVDVNTAHVASSKFTIPCTMSSAHPAAVDAPQDEQAKELSPNNNLEKNAIQDDVADNVVIEAVNKELGVGDPACVPRPEHVCVASPTRTEQPVPTIVSPSKLPRTVQACYWDDFPSVELFPSGSEDALFFEKNQVIPSGHQSTAVLPSGGSSGFATPQHREDATQSCAPAATIIQEAQERFCDVLSGPSTHEKKTRFKRASKEPERPPKVKKMKVTDTHEEV